MEWQGGALGYAPDGECEEVSGATLKAWTGLGWETLDESEGTSSDHTWESTDPDEIRRFFFGLPGEETLNVALTRLGTKRLRNRVRPGHNRVRRGHGALPLACGPRGRADLSLRAEWKISNRCSVMSEGVLCRRRS